MLIDMAAKSENRSSEALLVALAGALALAIAMGIGRFAFTPLLPMMLHDGTVDLHGGSTLATANYLGYLAGAILCMTLPAFSRRLGRAMPDNARLVRFALFMTAVLTLAMAWQIAALWPVWRFASGTISAVAFVYTSGWCLSRLVELKHAHLGGVIYTGPGIGIALSGFTAFGLTASGSTGAMGWAVFGVSAMVLTAVIWPVFAPGATAPVRAASAQTATPHVRQRVTLEEVLFTFAYGLAGLGYIVTATFLPVIARSALPGSGWVDLFWPLFGIAVAVGALLSRFVPMAADRRTLLVICYVLQGLGVLASLLVPTVAGFIAGSILLGLPFTTITLFAMQEVRRLRPAEPTGFMGLMTASYGIGQIAGPPLVSAILAHSPSSEAGFSLSLEIAAGSLFLGALVYAVMRVRFAITDM
ncbi:YbfB/YjiJ family MFS transporter [Rhizobium sp.]